MRVSLDLMEKKVYPKLGLQTNVNQLNSFIIQTHKNITHKETEKRHEIKDKKQAKIDFDKKFKEDIKKQEYEEKKLKLKANKHIEEGVCSTRDLNRILLCFDEPDFQNRPIEDYEVKDFTLLKEEIVFDGLKFLSKWNIIKLIDGKYLREVRQ